MSFTFSGFLFILMLSNNFELRRLKFGLISNNLNKLSISLFILCEFLLYISNNNDNNAFIHGLLMLKIMLFFEYSNILQTNETIGINFPFLYASIKISFKSKSFAKIGRFL